MPWTLALDLLLTGLLTATIAVALHLNRRLGEIRRHRAEVETLAATFDDATRRAENGVSRLKVSSDDLHELIARAATLSEDLKYLTERAEGAADRLETSVRSSRKPNEAVPAAAPARSSKSAGSRPAPASPAQAAPSRPPRPRSRAERELLEALGMSGALGQARSRG